MLKWVHQSSPIPKNHHVTSGLAFSSTSSSLGSTGSEEENDNKRNRRNEEAERTLVARIVVKNDKQSNKELSYFDEDVDEEDDDDIEIVMNENFTSQSKKLRASSRFEVVLQFKILILIRRKKSYLGILLHSYAYLCESKGFRMQNLF